MNRMLTQYLTTALWSSTGDDGEPLDRAHDVSDFAAESIAKATADCDRFAADNAADLANMEDGRAGHDLWLTRNRHGAGFWDRDLGEAGERLTASAHAMGETDCYVGDDGKVYLS